MMGVVYISREGASNRFTIGAAKSLPERKRGGYTRYNTNLKTYRVLRTPDYFAVEKFLHDSLAEKRDRGVNSTSWYLATPEEIDAAIDQAKTLGKTYIEQKKLVAELKCSLTDGEWIEPNERLLQIHAELSKIASEMARLKLNDQMLKLEAMAYIGKSEGVDGLFEWPAHEQWRFQTKTFAREHPDLYQAFREQKIVRRFKLCGAEDIDGDGSEEDF